MPLKTIDEHNDERREAIRAKEWSGIACPDCGSELKWEGRGVLLCSPPKRTVICDPECGFRTNVLA